ncbi:hypothetical protein CAPTEDRAFT_187308 [Capitella teleta]|uniref:Sulfotransferase domain-containing protein n=1 Tax=Capitella teleta TaxID=283909 RepID=X1ZK52_CAPTE|nr:hypothetical protein CAPTEDRAFT_187308 [Capitella teleta]|eukprot:ELU10142.1 hypothetical protein CAPTEDRAFT_187308 [Capitella teleta]
MSGNGTIRLEMAPESETSVPACPGKTLRTKSVWWPHTAFAGFQGSGLERMRYLVEEVTGYYTGSSKGSLRKYSKFVKNFVSDDTVIGVKMTTPGDEQIFRHFHRAVLLIRHPTDVFYSLIYRMASNKEISKEVWSPNTWREAVFNLAFTWYHFYLTWLNSFEGTKYVVFYSDIEVNSTSVLRNLVPFLLHKPMDESKLQCLNPNQAEAFRNSYRLYGISFLEEKLTQHLDNVAMKIAYEVKLCIERKQCIYKGDSTELVIKPFEYYRVI